MREFMPILRYPEYRLPWALIAPYERQAMRNHGQTLERLAERGGLSFTEAVCIIDGHDAGKVRHDAEAQAVARKWLDAAIAKAASGRMVGELAAASTQGEAQTAAPGLTVAKLADASDRKMGPILKALNVFGADLTINQPLDLALIGAALRQQSQPAPQDPDA